MGSVLTPVGLLLLVNLDPELFCPCRGERSRALGNPGARLSLSYARIPKPVSTGVENALLV